MTCVNSNPDLWHYTNIDAAVSILNTDILKATYYADLSDDMELTFGITEEVETISSNSYITSDLNYNVDTFNSYKDFLELADRNNRQAQGINGILDYYIVSFTTIPNSNYHWNTFCKKNNSSIDSGCALGFNKKMIENWISNELIANPNSPLAHFIFGKCMYLENGGLDSPLHNTINGIMEELKHDPISRTYFCNIDDIEKGKYNKFQIGLSLDSKLLNLSTQIKRCIYQPENEYRIVIDNTGYKPTVSKNNKRQIDLRMCLKETNLISKIIMSPHASVEDERTIQNAIDKNGLNISIQRN